MASAMMVSIAVIVSVPSEYLALVCRAPVMLSTRSTVADVTEAHAKAT